MNVLDLFSGIGGFTLGFGQAGMRTVAFCEIEPWCRAILRQHWPHIPIHDDIRKLDGRQYAGVVDLVCGGYPCQPFSVAGLRRGASDERHLWPEMHRLVREIRPRWVVAENVAGHIQLGFDEVAASLESDGFTVWPFVIPACAVGAWHRRDRLWIIAHADRDRPQGRTPELPPGQGQEHLDAAVLPGFSPVSPLHDKLSPPRLCGADDGIPHRAYRLGALGNAIVPQIAALIGQAIIAHERAKERR